MKFNRITILALIWAVLASPVANAQDNRTIKTQVADVLALFPAADDAEATRLYHNLVSLDDEGLRMVTDRVLPNGKEEGIAPRYAVSLLTHHAGSKEEKARIEKIYLQALSKADETEVKAYFIDNLKLIGTNASVTPLAEQIADKELTDQAVSALVSIGTPEARQALQKALDHNSHAHTQPRLIKALGELKHQPALQTITKFASSDNTRLKRHALWSMALIADAGSYEVLLQQAKNTHFKNDPAEATRALVEYMHQLSGKGNNALIMEISKSLLANTLEGAQQHFRLAALKAMTKVSPDESTRMLIKELERFDAGYQKEVLKIASLAADKAAAMKLWTKAYKKNPVLQPAILSMLAEVNRNDGFVESTLLPALTSKNSQTRMAAAEEIAYSRNEKFKPILVDYLLKAGDDKEINTAKTALLRVMDKDDTHLLAQKIESAQPKNKAAIIQILAERRAIENFDIVLKNTGSKDITVRNAAYAALPYLSSGENTRDLLTLLAQSENEADTKVVQTALITSLHKNAINLVNEAYPKNKTKILPLLPHVNDKDALDKVTSAFQEGNEKEKAAAFEALLAWQNHEAARTLLSIRRDQNLKKYHQKAFNAFVFQVGKSSWPDDQKLLMFDEVMTLAATPAEKVSVIRAVGNLRGFLALMFVSKYLDNKDLNRAASRSVMQIALPTSDARPGLTGIQVRNTLQKILDKLEGQDSQYEVIDIQTYLANLPYTKGFEPIFNGVDLTGWQGLVENPVARSKMSKAVLEKKQKEANAKSKESWSVKDGAIYFTGNGANLCTIRPYGDFEMIVDWKISKDGDSGIYLRGSPQVQIWDPTGKEKAATKVGSGGLYNNQKGRSTPLVVADNPIGEWNTFHIKMVGDVVTVFLNGVLVVDHVVLENYWDRNIPVFPEEAIELQAHGNELAFRNIYVKELSNKPYELTSEEKENGYELLFNGKDLDNWIGNKTDYVVEDNTIAIYPVKGSHGNLNTQREYSDFIFRFEFQLTPGANNGLGIHASVDGDAAYGGKEIQILDNTAPVYANLEPYQYHGSVYGLIPAKRGYLKPVGEWNQQEVYVKGDQIKVTLNGTVILDGDLKKATKNGTMDKKQHPGLNKHKGHIAFLGHGTIVKFRNIRIKDLSKPVSVIGNR
jgi:HEAT repeat protein